MCNFVSMKVEQIIDKIKSKLNVGINIKNLISPQEEVILFEYIVELNKNLSFVKISEKTGLSREFMRRITRKYGYETVNKQNVLRCRPDLFETISTEDDAYWLGFIFADGCISDTGFLEISLKSSDYKHLLKFADYCKFDKNKVVRRQPVGKYYRCRIGFKVKEEIQERLNSLGVVPRKSLTAEYPKIPEKLSYHFIRGYFDGDGCIYLRKPRTANNVLREISVNILGTKNLLTKINKRTGSSLKKIHKRKNIYELRLFCREARKFLKLIYEDSTIHLNRKYEKYQTEIAPLLSNV